MELNRFFEEYPEVAIAFSGGVDSAYLLYAASKYADRCTAYYVKAEFQPDFEYEDAVKLAESLGTKLVVLNVKVLENSDVRVNPENRCYYCKQMIFSNIIEAAAKDGYSVVLDGTNASDSADDRPGMKALVELEVLSPLRMCGLTKGEIRKRSKEAGLFTWNKPAYACLATRIPYGEAITREKLAAVEKAEEYLFSLGYYDLRVRAAYGHARIELPADQWMKLAGQRDEIAKELKKYFKTVALDLEARNGQ